MLFRDLKGPAGIIYTGISLLDTTREWEKQINEDFTFDYSNKELSKMFGVGISTVKKGLDKLVSLGVLEETKRPGHTTIYKLIKEIPIMSPEELEEWKNDPEHYITTYEARLEERLKKKKQ
jgi:transposase